MTERRARSWCLLINDDLEFYVPDQYIRLSTHDLMISWMCLSLTFLRKMSADKIGVISAFNLEANCLFFFVHFFEDE